MKKYSVKLTSEPIIISAHYTDTFINTSYPVWVTKRTIKYESKYEHYDEDTSVLADWHIDSHPGAAQDYAEGDGPFAFTFYRIYCIMDKPKESEYYPLMDNGFYTGYNALPILNVKCS